MVKLRGKNLTVKAVSRSFQLKKTLQDCRERRKEMQGRDLGETPYIFGQTNVEQREEDLHEEFSSRGRGPFHFRLSI